MPLVLRDLAVTTVLAMVGIWFVKTMVLATPLKQIPGLPQFVAII